MIFPREIIIEGNLSSEYNQLRSDCEMSLFGRETQEVLAQASVASCQSCDLASTSRMENWNVGSLSVGMSL